MKKRVKTVTISPLLRFAVFCISAFAETINSTNDVSYNVLSKYGILDYLEESYKTLHTQGRLYIVTDIVEMLIERGYFPKGATPIDIIPEYKNMQGVNS
ncbi:MAG: DUF3791 domain-containing protein [Oscillospiraceae bacterium]|nr:DUF3791 domain-containing protein [Oscillospiraceae bacterium]